ncbi:MAG: flippase-like domain-containing protein [Ruminococcus sp.]|nr:flippase-like domain-containing protein [Ruminococcus sp.]
MKNSIFKPKYIFNACVIGLCLGIVLYFFFSKDGLNDLIHSKTEVIWYWIAAAVGAQLLFMACEAIVIYAFIHDDYKNFRFIDSVRVAFMGLFWSAVTPSSTGGQPMQVYLMHSKNKVSIGYGTSRLIQKFMVYQVVLTSISLIAFLCNLPFIIQSSKRIPALIPLILFGFVTQITVTAVFLLFSFSPKLSRKLITFLSRIMRKLKFIKNTDEKIKEIEKQLEEFHTSNKDIYKKPKLLTIAFIFTFIEFIAIFIIPYFIFRSFGFDFASPVQLISSQAFVNLMSGMVPIPGASGAAELGFTVFFGNYFIMGTLKSAALIWRVINYYGVIALTGPFSFLNKSKDEKEPEKEKV